MTRAQRSSGEEPFALPAPWQSLSGLTITRVRAIVTAPDGHPLVVVRVETSEPGLYGYGCATFTQRYSAVSAVIQDFVDPLLVGRDPADIEDIGRLVHFSSYWRSGPVLNSALSGVDQALWDIAGRRAGLPVHDLVGGRQRGAVPVYEHASGNTPEEVAEDALRLIAEGTRHVRIQARGIGAGHYGFAGGGVLGGAPDAPYPDGWDVHSYLGSVPWLFAVVREAVGDDAELLHDVHSRLTPKQAIGLARRLEEYRPFFLEDPVAPEHFDRMPEVRASSPVPIAAGELLSSVSDAARMVTAGGVDYLRLHISAIGGFSAGRRLSALCELLGVSTAWHGPADVSPVGAAADVALDVTTSAFGIQEGHRPSEAVMEVFPGSICIDRGHQEPNLRPGWGIEIDEKAAARFPPVRHRHDRWASRVRRPDGSLIAP